jgi:hypothetical protein
MKTILLFITLSVFLSKNQPDLVFHFGNTPGKTNDWLVISDNVMGGVSQSTIEYKENSLLLSGDISLDNYGGFSSVKTRFQQFDLSAYAGVRIRCKSSNQKFAITLEDSRNWTQPNYKGDFFNTREDNWEVITLYFKDFKAYQIGEPTGGNLEQNTLKNIVRIGIITTEKKEGPFSLEVDFIEFIR